MTDLKAKLSLTLPVLRIVRECAFLADERRSLRKRTQEYRARRDRRRNEACRSARRCRRQSGARYDGVRPLAWYGDSAYGAGELRAAVAAAGHRAVIKPKPLQPAVPGGFTVDDFTVDEQAGAVTCPAGITRPVTPTRNVIFGAACGACPLRARCTTSKTGRTLSLHPHDGLLRAARADWAAGSGLRKDYMARRPNVERVIARVATWRERRLKLRYLGTAKNNAWLLDRAAALNLRNLISQGLACHDHAWMLS